MSKVRFSNPDRNFSCVDEDNCAQDNATNEDNNASKVFKNKLVKKEMELKLVAEIKERADQKHNKHLKDSPPIESILAVSGISHDPVSQLGECGNRENYYTGCLAMKNQTGVHFSSNNWKHAVNCPISLQKCLDLLEHVSFLCNLA